MYHNKTKNIREMKNIDFLGPLTNIFFFINYCIFF